MKKEQKSSLVWLIVALYICLETIRKLSLGSWQEPGPAFMPLLSGIFLGSLAVLNFIRSTLDKSPEDEKAWYSGGRLVILALILAALFAYTFLLETLGFLVGTFLLLVFLFRIVEPQRWIVAIGGSALFSLAAYAVFELWLRSQLPKGIWGF